jgi:hypothetical protein
MIYTHMHTLLHHLVQTICMHTHTHIACHAHNDGYTNGTQGLIAKSIGCTQEAVCVIFSTGGVKCFGWQGPWLGQEDSNVIRGWTPQSMGDNIPFVRLGTVSSAVCMVYMMCLYVAFRRVYTCMHTRHADYMALRRA